MTGMFVCVVEPRLDCRAKGPRHAVIRIMGSWSQRKDNQTCVPAYFCAQARTGTAVRVWIRLASATAKSHDNLKLSSQTVIDVCRSSCFAAHLSDISQCVHLFCINFCQDWKKLSTRPSKHTHKLVSIRKNFSPLSLTFTKVTLQAPGECTLIS